MYHPPPIVYSSWGFSSVSKCLMPLSNLECIH